MADKFQINTGSNLESSEGGRPPNPNLNPVDVCLCMWTMAATSLKP